MSGRNWFIIIALCLVGGMFFKNIPFIVAGIFLGVMSLISYSWNHLSLRRITYTRFLGVRRAFWGEKISYELIVNNNKILPLPWLHVEDTVPRFLSFYEGPKEILPADPLFSPVITKLLSTTLSMRWHERVRQRYEIVCNHRGVYQFGPTRLITGDLLAFKENIATFSHIDELMIYPRYVPVRGFPLLARQPYGDYRGTRRDLEDPLRPIAVRDYRYGDSWRRVHWKATARRGSLQSKVYEQTVTPEPIIILNVNSLEEPLAYVDAQNDSTPRFRFRIDEGMLELGITIAASLALHIVESGYQVGLLANGLTTTTEEEVKNSTGRGLSILPSNQKDQFLRILEELARFAPTLSMSISRFIVQQSRNLPYSTSILLITPTLDDDLLDTILNLKRYRQITVVYIGDKDQEFDDIGLKILRPRERRKWDELDELELV